MTINVPMQKCPKCDGRKVIPMCFGWFGGKMLMFDSLVYNCPQCKGTGKIPLDPLILDEWKEQFKREYELQWTDPKENQSKE